MSKNWHSSFFSWQWMAVESFIKIWIMVSNSAYSKMLKCLWADKKVEISNFIGLFCLKKNNFGGTEFETKSQFSPKLSMALHCQSRRLLCQFFAQETYFLAKTNLWNLKFWPFLPGWIKLAQFFLGWIGNQELVFPQTFHGTSVSEQETAISIYCSSNLCFSQNQPRKFEILTLLTRFNQIGTAFPGLNCKPGVSFPQNFSWPFNVTTWNSCHSFWLNQCTFQANQSYKSWNF